MRSSSQSSKPQLKWILPTFGSNIREGDLEGGKNNALKHNLCMDEEAWEGADRWPDDPFLAWLNNFDQDGELQPGWRPSLYDFEALRKRRRELHHTCCTLMSAKNDTICRHVRTERARRWKAFVTGLHGEDSHRFNVQR